ncbi:MAG: DUF2339 domain-containing protein [Sphingopyxis sp.]|uniref:DUF2339 domain-containing protein n=1 Tax=Sphingopyxis sp. TaxID=1908224 RepID=UPI003D80FBA5
MSEFLAFAAIMIMFVLLMDARTRLKRAEATLLEAAKRIGALQRHAGLLPPKETEPAPSPTMVEPPAVAAPPPPPPLREPPPRRAAAKAGAPAPSVAQTKTPVPAPSVSQPEPTAPSPPPPRGAASRFEDLFGKTLPIWAGGITLAIAGVLIVKYAIDLGFFGRIFTPGVQIVTGLLFGLGLIGGAELAWRNEAKLRDVRVPQALAGAGIATLYAAILVAANVYQLVGPLFAFAALAAITAAALGLSLRFGPPSALLGLAGGLAAPALVGAVEPNVPLLAIYLALTIAGLSGVARTRRWPWLALAALVGGVGWGLWMVLTSRALDVLGSLSIGGFVLLLAIALPMLAFDGPRAAALRAGSAIVGALQLALLVGFGGFTPLHWGLFALLAAAGQWLAWRDRAFAIVPTIGALLSVLLLGVWPDPAPFWFALIGLALAAIHALPLLARLWDVPKRRHYVAELCGIAMAAPLLVKWQYFDVGDAVLALVALGGALLAGAGMWRGWAAVDRAGDIRFAALTATAGALLALAILLVLPPAMAPLAIGAVAAAILIFAPRTGDRRIEPVATAFLLFAAALLGATGPGLLPQWERLLGGDAAVEPAVLLRWGALALLAILFAARAAGPVTQRAAQAIAALLGYGALALTVPAGYAMLVPAIGGAAVLLAARRTGLARVDTAATCLALLALAWAATPAAMWAAQAGLSLAGLPMTLDAAALGAREVVLRLLAPALLFGAALWRIRDLVPRWVQLGGFAVAGLAGGIALHCLYRIGFAGLAGDEFGATGIAQRLVWQALLIGGGWLALRRGVRGLAWPLVVAGTAHAVWYGLILHNPLWAEQAVGAWPLVNLLVPLFGMAWLGLALVVRLMTPPPAWLVRAVDAATMLLVAGFAWATLRQLFHGSLLVAPGVDAAENILRSLLILALAIGFLLWGIRAQRHDWRIASLVLMLGAVGKVFLFDASGLEGLLRIGSFVALGFSLIGIGWLYSRQLAGPARPPAGADG